MSYWDDVIRGWNVIGDGKNGVFEWVSLVVQAVFLVLAVILVFPFWLIGRMTPPKRTSKRRR